MDPLFTIVIPVRNRGEELQRALYSVQGQSFDGFECIVVDDASEPPWAMALYVTQMGDSRFRCVRLEKHSERIVAFNTGADAARGDWICRLDSDDEYSSHYLEVVRQAMFECPAAKCFNFGAVVHHRKREDGNIQYTGTSIRKTFKPAWLGDRHEEFRSGKIGAGSFVFHRSVWDAIEHPPEARSPYELHELATDVHHLYPCPGVTLGNPFGDDFLLFSRICRKFRSVPLEPALYIQHVRVQ